MSPKGRPKGEHRSAQHEGSSASAEPGRAPPASDPADALRRQCTIHVSGHPVQAPGEELLRVGAWCREHGHHADSYGRGDLVAGFESRVASLLGLPAAVFMPSGTMAQLVALRIAVVRAGVAHVAMHPTSHLELHEERAYAHLHELRVSLLGPRHRPLLADDLAACPERLAALLTELPAREIGGRLPAWDELVELSALARSRGIDLHLDGARLWEAREAYAPRTHAEIAALFDSVYVSFYKGVGALAGAMLLGREDFIAEARLWRRRQGGTLVQLHPFVASAAMRFDAQLARIPAWRMRAGRSPRRWRRSTASSSRPRRPRSTCSTSTSRPRSAHSSRRAIASPPRTGPGWRRTSPRPTSPAGPASRSTSATA